MEETFLEVRVGGEGISSESGSWLPPETSARTYEYQNVSRCCECPPGVIGTANLHIGL